MDEYTAHVRQSLNFLDYVPVILSRPSSARAWIRSCPPPCASRKSGSSASPRASSTASCAKRWKKQAPPTKAGKRLNIYYATQPRTDPPTFLFYVNDTNLVHFSYERYLENQIRARYSFFGTPLRCRSASASETGKQQPMSSQIPSGFKALRHNLVRRNPTRRSRRRPRRIARLDSGAQAASS